MHYNKYLYMGTYLKWTDVWNSWCRCLDVHWEEVSRRMKSKSLWSVFIWG